MNPPAGARGRGAGSGRRLHPALGLALLVGLTLAVFAPVLGQGFLELDDTTYVTENRHVREGLTGASVRWAWTSVGYAANWHPLTWISHMADVELFGLDPRGHHLVNLLLHALAAVLLGLALARLTGAPGKSLLVAALFAVHPLHVESVAWVAERKDVLAGLFWVLTLLAYARYVRSPGWGRYAAVALCFALGLAAKQTLVVLPLVLLALDVWPLRRWPDRARRAGSALGPGRALLEKVPLLCLAAGAGALTLLAQSREGMVATLEKVTVPMRLANAALSAATYVRKALWPSDLAFFYAYPEGTELLARGALAALLLAAATALALLARRRFPWLAAGWAWYALALLPVIGLVQVGQQSMADRYTYLPLIGLFLALAWGLEALAGAVRLPAVAAAAAGLLLVLLAAAAARRQVGLWRDGETLFEHAIAVTAGNWLAENNYGYYLYQKGQAAAAEAHYRAALRHRPRFAQAHNNLGLLLVRQGRVQEGMGHYREALAALPGYEVAHFNLGSALVRAGSRDEALGHFREAARLKPAMYEASYSAGHILELQNRLPEAARYYRQTLRFDPGHARAQQGLARLARAGVAPGD